MSHARQKASIDITCFHIHLLFLQMLPKMCACCSGLSASQLSMKHQNGCKLLHCVHSFKIASRHGTAVYLSPIYGKRHHLSFIEGRQLHYVSKQRLGETMAADGRENTLICLWLSIQNCMGCITPLSSSNYK